MIRTSMEVSAMAVMMQDEGLEVVTRDGAVVGTVKEVAGSYFKVDAPMKRDFWLEGGLVASREGRRLLLDLEKAELPQRRRPEPGLEAGEDPMAAIAGERVISEEELLRQRAQMEEELAEQSMKLPPHEPSITQVRGSRPYEKIPADHSAFREHAGAYVPNHAVLHYEEVQLRAGSRRRRVIAASVIVGAGTLGLAAIIAARRISRRCSGRMSGFKHRVEDGAQLLRRPHFGMRRLGMGTRLLRNMTAGAH